VETVIGKVSDYFAHINVMALTLESDLSVGDTIRVKGHTTDLTQTVDSMQIEHQNVQTAKAGDSIGIKVKERIRKGDTVYKVTP